MTTPTSEAGTTEDLLDNQIELFQKHLRTAGYAQLTLRKKRTVASTEGAGADLNDGHIAAFVSRSPRNRKAHVKVELAVMRLILAIRESKFGKSRFVPV